MTSTSSSPLLRRPGALDRRVPLVLAAGLKVIERDSGTVQIGAEPPQCVVIHDLPSGAAQVLAGIDGTSSTDDLVSMLIAGCGGDRRTWTGLLQDLCHAGVLHPHPVAAGLGGTSVVPVVQPESVDLHRRFGPRAALALLARREETLVIVRGAGRVASAISGVLAGTGVGHVLVQPTRPLLATDVTPAGLARGSEPDHERLAAVARRVHPWVTTHSRIPGTAPPTLVVLAGDRPASPMSVAELQLSRTPHLIVQAGTAGGVVGPLVLPGRSSCVNCLELHRSDRDPDWPRIARAVSGSPGVPTTVLSTRVAAAAAEQALTLIDGRQRPAAVDGTLEMASGDWRIRRRSWHRHPDCSCVSDG